MLEILVFLSLFYYIFSTSATVVYFEDKLNNDTIVIVISMIIGPIFVPFIAGFKLGKVLRR